MFGSIGYKEGLHENHDKRFSTRRRYSNLRMPKRSDFDKYIPIHETKDVRYIHIFHAYSYALRCM